MSLRKNFIYNTIYQMLIIIIPIITVPYVSRVLGPNGVGDYSYTLSYAQYFVMLGMIGISVYGSREVACFKNDKKKLSEQFWSIYILQFITTIIATIIYFFIFVGINNNSRLLYLIQGIVVITTIFDISWFFIGYEDMKSIVIRNSIVKILGVVSIFIFVKDSSDVVLYAFILAISSFIGQIVMWFNLFQKVEITKLNINVNKVLKHIRPAIGLFISQVAIQMYTVLDKTMLGAMTNVYQVGLYENSQKTIKLTLTLLTSLGVIMLPRMSSLYSEGKVKELKRLMYKALDYINFMAFPMVAGLIAISDGFSIWFYGREFLGVSSLLKIGSMIIIFISWGNIFGSQILLSMKKEKQFTIAVIGGAIINVIINFFIIKELKAVGTTIASVIAEFIVSMIYLYFLRNFVDFKKILKSIVKPLIGSAIMFMIIYPITLILNIGVLWTILEIIIGISVYLFLMYCLKDRFLLSILSEFKLRFIKKKYIKKL